MSKPASLPLVLCVCSALGAAAQAATVQHAESLRGYRVETRLGATKPSLNEPTAISFNAFSRDFALDLEPNGRLAAMQASLRLGAGTGAYRGSVVGRPGSWARLVLTPLGPSGIVFDGDTLYGIETGGDSSTPAANGPTMFRLADVYFAPGELGCEIGAVMIDAEQAVAAMVQEFTVLAAAGATLNLDLGAVADFEFSQAQGANADAALLTRFNNVDGLFSQQFGVQITVAEVDIFTTSADPFTTNDASDLLDELANYRGATPSQDAQGLTHLFTGRDLEGSTAGVAFLGSVCAQRTPPDTRSFGAGLSEGGRGAVIDSLVAAHEIGHNFGAPHDGDANGACASTPLTFLMAPSLNGIDQFSACSIAQMQPEIAAATCLTPIGGANMAVALPQPSQSVLATVAFSHTATVVNLGAETATGVTFRVDTEPGLDIVAATAGAASCTLAPTTATCALGDVGAGASRAVTLNLRGTAVGTFDLTGLVAADADTNAANNTATVSFTVLPIVDLVVTGASSSLLLDQQTTINATLENTADFAATSVTVTATLSAGLRPDLATLDGVACTITGQTIACPPRTLAAHGTAALALTATGIATGNQQVTVNATANEAERTAADNQLAIAVSVRSVTNDDGGGGGALSWLAVALLLAARRCSAAISTRRRRRFLPTPPGV